jgi:hypothetical protein
LPNPKIDIGLDEASGQYFARLPGGITQPVTEQQARLIDSDPGAIENFLQSAAGGAQAALLGGASLLAPSEYDRGLAKQALRPVQEELAARGMASPISTMTGGAAPAAGLAIATGGASLPAQAAIWGGYGAAMDPEKPLQGAIMGAALGAIPGAVGAIRGSRMADRVLESMGQARPGMVGGMGAVESGGARAGGAVPPGQGIPGTAAGMQEGRGLMTPGLMRPNELEAFGARLTPGERMYLTADDQAGMNMAQKARAAEDIRAAGAMTGGGLSDIKLSKAPVMSNIVRQELGDTTPSLFTKQKIGTGLTEQGNRIGAVSEATGHIPFAAENMQPLRALADASVGADYAPLIEQYIGRIEAASGRGGGAISPKDFQEMHSTLGKIIRDSTNVEGAAGRQMAASEIQQTLEQALESALPEGARAELRDARYKYRIYKTLAAPGVISKNANEINPVSFGNRWNKGIGDKRKSQDTLGRAAETLATLQAPSMHTGNTLFRAVNQAPERAAQAGLGAIAAGVGVPAIGSLFGL